MGGIAFASRSSRRFILDPRGSSKLKIGLVDRGWKSFIRSLHE